MIRGEVISVRRRQVVFEGKWIGDVHAGSSAIWTSPKGD